MEYVCAPRQYKSKVPRKIQRTYQTYQTRKKKNINYIKANNQ